MQNPINTNESSVRIGRAAQILGVSPSTIRRFEREGIMPEPVYQSGHRRYHIGDLLAMKQKLIRKRERHDQTLVVCRPEQILDATNIVAEKGWACQFITIHEAITPDMITLIVNGAVSRLVFLSVEEFDKYCTEPGIHVLFSAIDQAQAEIVLLPESLLSQTKKSGGKPC